MHGHFRHTPTIRNCPSFGCVLLLNQIYLMTYHYNLSDQSALEIRVRIIIIIIINEYD